MNLYFKTLTEIVMHPQHYRHFTNLPMAFDAAEELLNDYWEELPLRVKRRVSRILIGSGKYE